MHLLLALTMVAPALADNPPGPDPSVPVNSQPSLAKALGLDVTAAAWENPKGLVPAEFPGLSHVSDPDDQDLAPKAAWRKPLVLSHKAPGKKSSSTCIGC